MLFGSSPVTVETASSAEDGCCFAISLAMRISDGTCLELSAIARLYIGIAAIALPSDNSSSAFS
jgi:hypothetical protein